MNKGSSLFRRHGKSIFFMGLILTAVLPSALFSGIGNVRSSSNGVSFTIEVEEPRIIDTGEGIRILLDGYGTFSPAGAVEIPGKVFNVAVPEGSSPVVRFSVMERQVLGRIALVRHKGSRLVRGEDDLPLTETYMPEDPWAGKGVPPIVRAGEVSYMGRVPVLPLAVNLVGGDDSGYWIARKISVTVSMETSGLGTTGLDGGGGTGITGILETHSSKAWSNIYQRALVNPDDAALYVKPLKDSPLQASPQQNGRRIKISIPETGLYCFSADSLLSTIGGGPLAVNQFALKRYYYDEAEPDLLREVDIPMNIVKGTLSSSQYFEADDLLYFYATGIRDDAEAGDPDAAFTDRHLVWLVEGEAGVGMREGTGRTPATGAAEPYFISEIKLREDKHYQKDILGGTTDFYFVETAGETETTSLFNVIDPYGQADFSLSATLRGFDTDGYKPLTFEVRNSTGTHEIGTGYLIDNLERIFQFDSQPSEWLTEGENTFAYYSDAFHERACMLNYFSVSYPRLFILRDGMLEFDLEGTGGTKSVEIEGFGSPSGYLIDLADELDPVVDTLTAGLFSGPDGNGVYTLSLELPSDSYGKFITVEAGSAEHIYNAWMDLDNESSLKSETGPFHTLVISHEDFLPPASSALSDYLAWRDSLGYDILQADVQDVYDEFNGGLPSYNAVKRFISYGFENWGVEFVMLVGDASEDHKRLYLGDPPDTRGSPPDFVPAYTYSMPINAIGYKDEVVATDKFYSFIDDDISAVMGPALSDSDEEIDRTGRSVFALPAIAYPDVFLGRIPVGSETEASAAFLKLRRYEGLSTGDSWRRNIILFSDDAWSGSSATYTYRSSEERFEASLDTVGTRIERAFPGAMNVERLFLSHWTDGVHPYPPGQNPPVNRSVATDSTRTYFSPYIIDRLNEGALFYVFQGHASRNNMTTEAGFSNFSQYKDVRKLFSNKINVFVGLGCHISEFALFNELNWATISGPGGDCLSEQFVLKGGSGSVAAYASTAYEDLIKNANLCENMFDFIFTSPPSDSIPPGYEATGARWILGELITAAEIDHINRMSYGVDQAFRYVLFGDPMQKLDSGPPVIEAEIDWGDGWEEAGSDTLDSRNRDNICDIRLTATDVVALGGITLEIDGESYEGLRVEPIDDTLLTYSRSYRAVLEDYTLNLLDENILFRVLSTSGDEIGSKVFSLSTEMKLYYVQNGNEIEVGPGGSVPEDAELLALLDFPVFLENPPGFLLDGNIPVGLDLIPLAADSTDWEARFKGPSVGGTYTITVESGEFAKDFDFEVSGGGIAIETYSYPNPFRSGTNIMFTLDSMAERGEIRIYNVSGILIREFELSGHLLSETDIRERPHAVYWDGRDMAGNRVANGNYIYFLDLFRGGDNITRDGIVVKLE